MLDGMVDVVFAEIALPSPDEHWKSGMRRRAVSARHLLARHRWAIGLTESRTKPGPTNLRHHDSVIGCLRNAGFPIEIAIHAYSTLDSYIYGFALQEQQLPFAGSANAGDLAEQILQQFPVGEYPHLAETVAEVIKRSGWKYADEFDFGLDLILDGLERFLTS